MTASTVHANQIFERSLTKHQLLSLGIVKQFQSFTKWVGSSASVFCSKLHDAIFDVKSLNEIPKDDGEVGFQEGTVDSLAVSSLLIDFLSVLTALEISIQFFSPIATQRLHVVGESRRTQYS